MRIAIDAMGGDFAPKEIVLGGIEGAIEYGVEVILVGDEKEIKKCMEGAPETPLVKIRHASEVIGMDESPSKGVRKKKDASIVIAAQLVGEGEADAVVAAGNTGAAMAACLFKAGRIPGLERPAIATLWPGIHGTVIMLDAGANKDCKPGFLLEFALMGDLLARAVYKVDNPKIGLLNIGEEATKGNELTFETHKLLSKADINFIGNVEGTELLFNKADVVVCDGFTGNMVLKTGEGAANFIVALIKQQAMTIWPDGNFSAEFKTIMSNAQKILDFSEHGGAPLIGINGICIITHGRAKAKAIRNAIKMAIRFVESGFVKEIASKFK
jgi:glycerol-3-phosphate acyltransferase PlsX